LIGGRIKGQAEVWILWEMIFRGFVAANRFALNCWKISGSGSYITVLTYFRSFNTVTASQFFVEKPDISGKTIWPVRH
jgi:hypothetical protein